MLEDKLAKNVTTVNNFLRDLREKLTIGGRAELEKLKSLKKKDLESRGETYDGHYFVWDDFYYGRIMLEQEYAVDKQKIAEFFPFQNTLQGMLRIFEQLFGMVFVEIPPGEARDRLSKTGNGTDIVWHEDVQVFSVWDDRCQGGGFLGYLYMVNIELQIFRDF